MFGMCFSKMLLQHFAVDIDCTLYADSELPIFAILFFVCCQYFEYYYCCKQL